jgi:hypothetical protein
VEVYVGKAMTITVMQIKSEEAEPWCKRKHYARRVPGITFAFGLYNDRILEGVVTYGSPPTPAVAQGMFADESMSGLVIELNRLCLDTQLKNAASIIVGRSLALLPRPKCVVSYADTGVGHIGYIYQATNFLYTGAVTAHDAEYIVNGVKTHARTLTARGITEPKKWARDNKVEMVLPKPKHRYIYLCGSRAEKQKMMKNLNYKILAEYPKGDSRRYDASAKIQTQGVLFV